MYKDIQGLRVAKLAQVIVLCTKAQSQSDVHRGLQQECMVALHMSTVLAVTRGYATNLILSEIQITDRPSKRVPRDTLYLLLLETPTDTQPGALPSTSYHNFCGELRET